MLTKIKILFLSSILTMSCQTTLFAMNKEDFNSDDINYHSISHDNDDNDADFFDQKSTNNTNPIPFTSVPMHQNGPRKIDHLNAIPEYTDHTKVHTLDSAQELISNILKHLERIDAKNEIITNDDIIIIKKHFNNLATLYKDENDKQKYLNNINFNFFFQHRSSEDFTNPTNRKPINDLETHVNQIFKKNTIMHKAQQPNEPEKIETTNTTKTYPTGTKNNKDDIALSFFPALISFIPANIILLTSKTTTKNVKKELDNLLSSSEINTFTSANVKRCQQLWSDYLMLHNYNATDRRLYPFLPNVEDNEEKNYKEKLIRRINLLFHPDKINQLYNTNQINYALKEKIANTLKYINGSIDHSTYEPTPNKQNNQTNRPDKSSDFIVDYISFVTPNIEHHTKLNILATVCSLPSLLFPNYFENKEISRAIKATDTDIKECNNLIIEHKNGINHRMNTIQHYGTSIKRHENAIKRKDLTISIKQQQVRDAFNTLFPNKNVNN